MHSLIKQNLPAIVALCEKHQVQRLYLIGSALGDDFDPQRSDVDFVVEFRATPNGRGLMHPFFVLTNELEKLLGQSVDVIEWKTLKNPYLMVDIIETRELLYDATAKKVAV